MKVIRSKLRKAREAQVGWWRVRRRLSEVRALRRELIELKGGRCTKCGCRRFRELQFHHVDPATKRFCLTICQLWRSRKEIDKEVAKCTLLCGLCHKAHHAVA